MTIVQGGGELNAIPESATIAGTFRALGRKSFYALRKRIGEVCCSFMRRRFLVELNTSRVQAV